MAAFRGCHLRHSSETITTIGAAARCLAALAILAGATVVAAPGAGAAAPEDQAGLTWTATIDGRQVSRIDDSDPLELGSEEPTTVVLSVTNGGEDDITVNTLRLEGRVLGLAFFTYSVRLAIDLAPGDTAEREVALYLDDITDQANGLIPARFELLDADRNSLASEEFPVDVQGSLWSTYGWFGLAVAACTALLIGALLLAIARTGKPGKVGLADNRWLRGVQFAVPGVGVGLTVTFTLSVTSLLLPSLAAWLPIVLICAAGAFALGYFLPIGRTAGDEDVALEEQGAVVGSHLP